MGFTDKDRPSWKASSMLRQFARETPNTRLAEVIRLLESRLGYFRDWEGSLLEGKSDHLAWAWSIQTELRDLNYLGLVPIRVVQPVNDLLEQAINHSMEVRAARYESNHL